MTDAEVCIKAQQQMGYWEWHKMADMLHKRGVRQKWCGTCKRWRYPSERCQAFKAQHRGEEGGMDG
jgi:hypothetical protein